MALNPFYICYIINLIMNQRSSCRRNSSVELLRILAMFFIVLSHSSVHGNFPIVPSSMFVNNIFLDWCVLGNLGVDLFLIITGYFLCLKENTIKSLRLLHSQVIFYSILGLIVAFILNIALSVKAIIISLFPVLFKEYWFFTAYIVLLLLSPYVNIFLNTITKKQFQSCLLLMLFLWAILPTFTTCSMYGAELAQFMLLYMLGAYIRKYPQNVMSHFKVRFSITFLSFVLLFLSSVVFRMLGESIPLFLKYSTYFYGRNSLLTIFCAIGLFTLSIYKKPFYNNRINVFSSCTFGVYLIHENIIVREILWEKWFPNFLHYNSEWLIFYIIGSVLLVFLSCIVVEYIRKRFFEKYCLKLYMCVFDRVDIIFRSIKCGIVSRMKTLCR